MDNFNWTCPFCNRHSTITDQSVCSSETYLSIANAEGDKGLTSRFVVCPNSRCNKFTLMVSLHDASFDARDGWEVGNLIKTWLLIPNSRAKQFPTYIPKPVLDD